MKLTLFFGLILIVSISLKYIMSSTISPPQNGNRSVHAIISTYSQIDSLLVFNNDSRFGRIYHQNWHQQLKFFKDSDFFDGARKAAATRVAAEKAAIAKAAAAKVSVAKAAAEKTTAAKAAAEKASAESSAAEKTAVAKAAIAKVAAEKAASMKYYAFGNLYYNLWREAIAARNLLLEIQHSLFLEPAIDRFFPQIPIPKDVLLEEYHLKPGHLAVIKKQYNNYKNKFHTYDMGLNGSGGANIFLIDYLANTKYFDSLAHKYFEETTNQLASFIDLEDSLFTGSLKSRVRLAFLYAIKKEKGKIGNIIPQTLFNVIIDSLYADNYALKIEVIELLPYLENIGFINQEDIAEIHSSLNFELAKALLQSKREVMGLKKIDGLPIINQETIQKEIEEEGGDIVYYPEYIITKSEIYLMNNDIKKAEEIINHLWFKDSSPNPPPYSWWFNNYPEYLLKTIRLGYWDGARLPHYIGEIFDLYSENKDFKGIRDTLSLLVARVTRHVGKSTAHN